ncbi:MAG: helix-turn-helix domain-containing protein [Candidatus Dadabacteria bacterium]|nr:helix-turn-helix domain-containing protein [Candidatus Dadabacteria bacterium]NIS09333.1 helix-turn-helix domain-containing protein [Candidatus Dadabacteria bacterium]NIV42248.1 helix-turn-helix domain-containing protein [Candidatus Dadabacteria bacterium]NIY22579.1 helix-turn-helix domain-containing protein [Candidatus Dadabacteria bacterium]
MKQIFVRDLTKSEINHLYKGLNSASAFILRRCQIILSSAEGKNSSQISQILYCSDQCVRDAINAFNKNGIKSLNEKSHARQDNQKKFSQSGAKKLVSMAKDSPRKYGVKSDVWTLDKLAKTCSKHKLVSKSVSPSTVAAILKQKKVNWKEIKKT